MSYPLELKKSATIDLLAKTNDEVEKFWREWAEEYCRREREAMDEFAARILNNGFSSK